MSSRFQFGGSTTPDKAGYRPGMKSTRWFAFVFVAAFPTALMADEIAVTASGKRVLLKDDGTWTAAAPTPTPPPELEARNNLREIFTAEKAFFGEYNTYASDLVSVNWFPEGTPAYVYGSCSAFPAKPIPGIPSYDGRRNNTSLESVRKEARPAYSDEKTRALGDPCVALRKLGLDKDAVISGQKFHVFAIGNLGNATPDVWTIDEVKELKHVHADR